MNRAVKPKLVFTITRPVLADRLQRLIRDQPLRRHMIDNLLAVYNNALKYKDHRL